MVEMAFTNYKMVGALLVVILLFGGHVITARGTECPELLPSCVCYDNDTKIKCDFKNLTKIPDGIPTTAETLNLRYNSISQLAPNMFGSLSRLQKLQLDYNFINIIEQNAFSNLSKLQFLSLTSNNIGEINKTTFSAGPMLPSPLPNLKQLWLNNNFIKVIKSHAFSNLPQLQALSLYKNSLTQLNNDTFVGIPLLETLDLSHNAISILQDNTFVELGCLKRLDLSGNTLKVIPDIGYLPNLRTLHLSSNYIENATFPSSFQNCTDLSSITLRNNRLRSLHKSMFRALFSNVRFLVVDVNWNQLCGDNWRHCGISSISFHGTELSVELGGLDRSWRYADTILKLSMESIAGSGLNSLVIRGIAWTRSRVLQNNTFEALSNSSLETLEISNCNMQELPRDFFVGLNTLENLTVASSEMKHIHAGAFNGLDHLRVLNLTRNKLTVLPSTLPTSLETLTLKENRIKTLSYGLFTNNSQLRDLDLSCNNIGLIYSLAFAGLKEIRELDLRSNGIFTIFQDVFVGLDQLVTLNLSHNKIGSDVRNLRTLRPLVNLRSLSLAENRITRFRANGFSSLTLLRHLDLSNNKITILDANIFVGLTSLQTLHLERNQLHSIERNGLLGLSNLQEFHLTSNSIRDLHNTSFEELSSLRFLKLDGNNIGTLTGEAFTSLRNLIGLDLSENSIYTVKAIDDFPSSLNWVNLTGNLFLCDCELLSFRDWLKRSSHIFPNYESYKCYASDRYGNQAVLDFSQTRLDCDLQVLGRLWMLPLAALMGVIFILITACMMYKRRWHIKLCIHEIKVKRKIRNRWKNDGNRWKNYGNRWKADANRCDPGGQVFTGSRGGNGEDNQDGPVFDAYVSYADEDIPWVMDQLLPGIDQNNGGKFRLCLHQDPTKDDRVTSIVGYMTENLGRSRKAIIILSRNYLNPWNLFEMEVFLHQMYEGKLQEIIILHIDVNVSREELTPKYLSYTMKRHTFLLWSYNVEKQIRVKKELVKCLKKNCLAIDKVV